MFIDNGSPRPRGRRKVFLGVASCAVAGGARGYPGVGSALLPGTVDDSSDEVDASFRRPRCSKWTKDSAPAFSSSSFRPSCTSDGAPAGGPNLTRGKVSRMARVRPLALLWGGAPLSPRCALGP